MVSKTVRMLSLSLSFTYEKSVKFNKFTNDSVDASPTITEVIPFIQY